MINCYETACGDHAPAHALTAAEALDLHRRGVLAAVDVPRLSIDARLAVLCEAQRSSHARRRSRGRGVTICWGVRTPTRAYQGRA